MEGGYEKIAGARGTFATFAATRAARGVRSAPPSTGRRDIIALNEPQGFTDNPDTAMAATRDYFVSLGLSETEVGGTHVTTTMGGSGKVGEELSVSKNSKFMWYTGHLNRAISEIPVESSYAFAAFDKNNVTITEGVWWPDIPIEVVQDAVDLRQSLADEAKRRDYLALIEGKEPGASDTEGEVRIIHTSATYDGEFTARAGYCVAISGGGKVRVPCFASGSGERIVMPDAVPTGTDTKR